LPPALSDRWQSIGFVWTSMSGRAQEQHGERNAQREGGGVRIYDRPEESVHKRLWLSLWLVFLLVLMVIAIAWLRR
jgi:hypothetical protein